MPESPEANDYKMRLAALLSLTREELGRTAQEIADQVGVHVSVYGSWERGKHVPESYRLGPVARALHLRHEDVLFPPTRRDVTLRRAERLREQLAALEREAAVEEASQPPLHRGPSGGGRPGTPRGRRQSDHGIG